MPWICSEPPVPRGLEELLDIGRLREVESPTNHLQKGRPLAAAFLAFLQGWAVSSGGTLLAELPWLPLLLAWGCEGRRAQVP